MLLESKKPTNTKPHCVSIIIWPFRDLKDSFVAGFKSILALLGNFSSEQKRPPSLYSEPVFPNKGAFPLGMPCVCFGACCFQRAIWCTRNFLLKNKKGRRKSEIERDGRREKAVLSCFCIWRWERDKHECKIRTHAANLPFTLKYFSFQLNCKL